MIIIGNVTDGTDRFRSSALGVPKVKSASRNKISVKMGIKIVHSFLDLRLVLHYILGKILYGDLHYKICVK